MSDQLQGETQQRDGPRGDAESLVKKWITTLQDESRVTDEDAEDLTLRIIAFAATSSPTPADAHQVRCVHGVPEGLTCAICGPIRNDDPPTLAPAERTRVVGEHHEFLQYPKGMFRNPNYDNGRCWYVVGFAYCGQPADAEIHKPVLTSDSARRAAEEIRNYVDSLICAPPMREFERAEIERIISKNFAAAPTAEQWRQGMKDAAKEVCDACDNEERYGSARKIEGSTRWWHGDDNVPCKAGGIWHALAESTVTDAAAPADNDAESLLSKITTIADIGSAEEFGDALERLQSIRRLIDTTTTKGDR